MVKEAHAGAPSFWETLEARLWQGLEADIFLATDSDEDWESLPSSPPLSPLRPPPAFLSLSLSLLPTVDSPRSPIPSLPSSMGDRLAASRRSKMERTNAWLLGHHHEQMVAMMKVKARVLETYERAENRKVLHLDWIAGNPADPAVATAGSNAGGAQASSSGSSGLTNVGTPTADVYIRAIQHLDSKEAWNKSALAGDWLTHANGERQFYLEIQIKRISGADEELLQLCGIQDAYAWLAMHDPAKVVEQIKVPESTRRMFPAIKEAHEDKLQQQREQAIAAAASTSLQSPESSADKGKGKAVAVTEGHVDASAAPRTALDLNRDEVPVASTGIIGEQNSPSPKTDNESTEESDGSQTDVASASSSSNATRRASSEGPYDGFIQTRMFDLEEMIAKKMDELRHIFSFTEDPTFRAIKAKSFIYAVRVIAIPGDKNVVNLFRGPAIPERKGTLLAQGGWVVPPMEERLAYRNRGRHNRKAAKKQSKNPPKLYKPERWLANQMWLDWTNDSEPRYHGLPMPLWNEPVDPCLEDVYWMVWQLLSGVQYIGVRSGYGFGIKRHDDRGDKALLDACPFRSPSLEAKYYPAVADESNGSKS